MKWEVFICSLALFASFVLADSDVLVLTDETFDDAIKNNPYIMVLFFAPWCGHCKAFAPSYEKAAALIKEKGKPYVLAKLDATVNKIVADKVGVQGFPTVMFYVNGNQISYDGERTTDDVITFLKKKSKPDTTELKSKEDIEKVQKEDGRRCILSGVNEKSLKVYGEIAKNDSNYIFYYAQPKLLQEIFPEVAENNVVILRDYDEPKIIYAKEMETEPFQEFLNECLMPLAGEIDKMSIDKVFNPNGKTGILLFRDPKTEAGQKLDEEFKELATELKSNDFVFIKVDIKTDWGSRIAEHLIIEQQNLPIFEIDRENETTERYRHTGKLNKQAMKQFIEDWKNGKIPRFYNSEPEPEDNDGPVYKVVATTFNGMVKNNDDDILLYYHAPWCKQCKAIMTMYQKLAGTLTEFTKLKFMQIDGHKNDLKEHIVTDYPKIKMFRGKNKTDVLEYQGPFSEHSLAIFIKSTASHTVDIPELRAKDEGERNIDDLQYLDHILYVL